MYYLDTSPDLPPVPDWVQYAVGNLTLLQVVFWVIAIITLIALILKLWPVVSKFVQIVNATAGLPKFIQEMEARLVVDDTRHKALSKQVSEIHHEVHFNNGTSVKDGVRRIEQKLNDQIEPTLKALARSDEKIREDFGITEEIRRRKNVK